MQSLLPAFITAIGAILASVILIIPWYFDSRNERPRKTDLIARIFSVFAISLSLFVLFSSKNDVEPGLKWKKAILESGSRGCDPQFYSFPAYTKSRSGIVYLRGCIEDVDNPNDTVFVLPEGYRPASQLQIIAACHNGANCEVTIEKTGRVRFTGRNTEESKEWVSIDNICFVAGIAENT